MYVYLKHDGFYSHPDSDEKLDEYEFSRKLQDSLEIKGKVTFENVFDILIRYENIDLLFSSWTRGFKLQPFYEDLQKDPDIETDLNDLDFLELSWGAEIMTWEDDDCINRSEFEISTSMSGVDDSVKENGPDKSRYYSLSLSDLSDFKHLPIKLDEEFKIHKINDDYDVISESTKKWDIYNFIGTILNEISFHGYPEDHQKVVDSLNGTIDNMDNEELIPFEKVMIDMLEKKLVRLEENQKYEKAAKVRDEINEYKSKLKD